MQMDAAKAGIRFKQNELNKVRHTVVEWTGKELFNTLYEHRIVVKSGEIIQNTENFFLAPAAIEIDCVDSNDRKHTRLINGIIREVMISADEENHYLYTFFIVPRLWSLSRNDNTRILKEKSSESLKSIIK